MSIRKLYNRICEIHRSVPADGAWGILIGKTVDRQIRDGRYDGAMGQRYNIREAGRNG